LAVPGRLQHISLKTFPADVIHGVSHSTSSDCTTLPAQHFRSLGLFCRGPTVWNSLPDSLRDPTLTSNSFRQSLKTNLFRRYHSAHTAQ